MPQVTEESERLGPTKEGFVPPDHKQHLFCEDCQEFFVENCPVHGPPPFIKDAPVEIGLPCRAFYTLPAGLAAGPSQIRENQLGIWCVSKALSRGIFFGPLEGKLECDDVGGRASFMSKEIGEEAGEAQVNQSPSNWMRYANKARTKEESNAVIFQFYGKIYYRLCKTIELGQELLLWPEENQVQTTQEQSNAQEDHEIDDVCTDVLDKEPKDRIPAKAAEKSVEASQSVHICTKLTVAEKEPECKDVVKIDQSVKRSQRLRIKHDIQNNISEKKVNQLALRRKSKLSGVKNTEQVVSSKQDDSEKQNDPRIDKLSQDAGDIQAKRMKKNNQFGLGERTWRLSTYNKTLGSSAAGRARMMHTGLNSNTLKVQATQEDVLKRTLKGKQS